MKELIPGFFKLGLNFSADADTEKIYNSYLVSSEGKNALFNVFPGCSLEELKGTLEDNNIELDYLILGSNFDYDVVAGLVSSMPQLKIIGTQYTTHCFNEFYGDTGRTIFVRNKNTLKVGNKTLRFHVATLPLRPSVLYTIIEEDGVAISPDLFNADCCEAPVDGVDAKYKNALRSAFRDFQGYGRTGQVLKTINVLREKNVGTICPAYGPVLEGNLDEIYSVYEALCSDQNPNEALTAVVAYDGSCGPLRVLAGEVKRGLEETATPGEPLKVCMYDISSQDTDSVLRAIRYADMCVFGVASNGGTASRTVWELIGSLRADLHGGKPAAVFGHSDSEANDISNITARLTQLGMTFPEKPLISSGYLDKTVTDSIYELGFSLGCLLAEKPNPHRAGRMVRCLVCGEIFDASLGTCPVCGVGLDQCVDVEEDEILISNDTDDTYLILGGGAAAVSAADAIRKRDKTGRIIMLSAEKFAPINRPKLTKDRLFEMPIDKAFSQIAMKEEGWYEENGIELHISTTVTSLDPPSKTVTVASGEVYSYDKLIYAMGAECAVPPFKGTNLPEVVTIRHLEDMEKISKLNMVKNVVVIGGGALGLEAAWVQLQCRRNVTIVDAAPKLIGAKVDDVAFKMLLECCDKLKVPVYLSASVAEITGPDHVTGVSFADGTHVPADMVIISCGNRANIAVAKEAGITAERSIIVDSGMHTNIPDIFACGDCASFDGVNGQLWSEAVAQGTVAGANAAGDNQCFQNEPLGLSFDGLRTSIYSIGDISDNPEYKSIIVKDATRGHYLKYWFKGDTLKGAILMGDVDDIPAVTEGISGRRTFKQILM